MRVYEFENYIEIKFNYKIYYNLYEEFKKIQSIKIENFQIIYLDFSSTGFISLAGGIYIIYFNHYLKQKNNLIETRIKSINPSVARTLAKFGFFKCSKIHCNLHLDDNLERLNNRFLGYFDIDNIQKHSSIYWPIRTIPKRIGNYFESDDAGYINSFIDYFNLLVISGKLPIYNISQEEVRKGFIKASYELGLNIWEHSNSWGLSSIQSTDETKTTIAICDYGDGFIGNYIVKNPEYKTSAENDKNLLEELLEDGGTSKQNKNKNGHGLSRVIKFTRNVEGTLLVRTDSYEITLVKNQKKPKIIKKTYFKGTQVFINF
jgi:anti-anti-sigma regulatory factor